MKKKDSSIKEFIRYLIVGFSNTGINWAVNILLTELTPLGNPSVKLGATIAVIIAWIVSTIFFAFWAYKLFVFRSKSMVPGILWKEFVGFTSARLLTLGVEMAITLLFCDVLGFDESISINLSRVTDSSVNEFLAFNLRERYFVKLFACVVVTILNYVFSKLIIFKKGQKLSREAEADLDEGESKA
ncbi:MAG: GtrA family protein [Ruminococcaceae bacterium]|nr:GtrA family protein [Oscillospiraceae bacterium]